MKKNSILARGHKITAKREGWSAFCVFAVLTTFLFGCGGRENYFQLDPAKVSRLDDFTGPLFYHGCVFDDTQKMYKPIGDEIQPRGPLPPPNKYRLDAEENNPRFKVTFPNDGLVVVNKDKKGRIIFLQKYSLLPPEGSRKDTQSSLSKFLFGPALLPNAPCPRPEWEIFYAYDEKGIVDDWMKVTYYPKPRVERMNLLKKNEEGDGTKWEGELSRPKYYYGYEEDDFACATITNSPEEIYEPMFMCNGEWVDAQYLYKGKAAIVAKYTSDRGGGGAWQTRYYYDEQNGKVKSNTYIFDD